MNSAFTFKQCLRQATMGGLTLLSLATAVPADAFILKNTIPAMISPGAKHLPKGQSRFFDLGKNVKPRFVRESVRPDGSRSVVYGNTPGGTDRIGKPHGHSVRQPDGRPEYARTIGGRVLFDNGSGKSR